MAASEFFKNNFYTLESEEKTLSEDMINYLSDLTLKYYYFNRRWFRSKRWGGWKKLNQKLGSSIQIVGDDLTVTNIKHLNRAIDEKSMNSILIKLNQIGTITETIEAVQLAKKVGFGAIISHRSGETEDTIISDFSVAMGMGQWAHFDRIANK